jgi:uncharacterized protein with HEPN domain
MRDSKERLRDILEAIAAIDRYRQRRTQSIPGLSPVQAS